MALSDIFVLVLADISLYVTIHCVYFTSLYTKCSQRDCGCQAEVDKTCVQLKDPNLIGFILAAVVIHSDQL